MRAGAATNHPLQVSQHLVAPRPLSQAVHRPEHFTLRACICERARGWLCQRRPGQRVVGGRGMEGKKTSRVRNHKRDLRSHHNCPKHCTVDGSLPAATLAVHSQHPYGRAANYPGHRAQPCSGCLKAGDDGCAPASAALTLTVLTNKIPRACKALGLFFSACLVNRLSSSLCVHCPHASHNNGNYIQDCKQCTGDGAVAAV